jgi:Fibronectin type III domain
MPILNATRTLLKVAKFPAKAMFISAYYHEVGAATPDLNLGSSTTTDISFPALNLTPGTQYEFWITATNAHGSGQPSPKLLVTGP